MVPAPAALLSLLTLKLLDKEGRGAATSPISISTKPSVCSPG
jgi:hypothetical protein